MSVGSNIRNIRKSKGYSIMNVRELTGLSKSTISELENDKSSPTTETLNKLAKALDVPVSAFFDEDYSEKKERDYSLTIKEQENIDLEAQKILDELSISFSKNKDMLTDEDYFAIENALKITLESIKIKNKKKFTPKKYR
ncbi:helix-turn-helix domain-containing protein [uncultured Clostridium sp.]|uniref:helix-turn-helix domain-containing protein n=1 Tax=uncultured Clostridium sp. TaxID=59620 RepID=UPI00280C21C1|nr:helix-turn-helix domain-containing protein [uncultured Clostridium sp.]